MGFEEFGVFSFVRDESLKSCAISQRQQGFAFVMAKARCSMPPAFLAMSIQAYP